MIFFIATIAVQIACVVHLIRNHRNNLWLWAIILLPIAASTRPARIIHQKMRMPGSAATVVSR